MLSAAEIADMRSAINELMPGTAVIQTRTRVSDGQGGGTTTYTATGTVDARIDYEGREGQEPELGGRIAEVGYYILTTPNGTSVPSTARIVYDSTTYEVVESLVNVPWNICQRTKLRKVD